MGSELGDKLTPAFALVALHSSLDKVGKKVVESEDVNGEFVGLTLCSGVGNTHIWL